MTIFKTTRAAALRPATSFLVSCLALAISVTPTVASAQDLAITAAKIIPIVGDPIEDGVIIIRDGKIEEIGLRDEVEIPVELKVVAAPEGVVMPGYIDAHNPAPMSQANENNPIVPFLSVVDSIDPNREYFEVARRNGITTVSVVPGDSTLIGGQSAIMKTAGGFVDDMLLKRASGMKISLVPRNGGRMSHIAQLRRELDKAVEAIKEEKEAEEKKADDEKKDSKKADKDADKDSDKKESDEKDADEKDADEKNKEEAKEKSDKAIEQKKIDDGLEAMKKVVSGELPVFMYCNEPMDIATAQRLASKYDLDIIYVLSRDTYKAFGQLKETKHPVILDPTLVYWRTDPRTREGEKIVIPELLMQNEVPFVFQTLSTSSYQTYGNGYFWYQAATAIKYGMDRNEALKALTLLPAELLGIEEFVGSIEVGKDADLVVLTGDPLDASTWVEKTIIGGEVVYDKSEDKKIQRLLSEEAE